MSYPPSLIFCYNSECNNPLTSYELRKLNTKIANRFWFCHVCRRKKNKPGEFMRVRCVKCDEIFVQENYRKICENCNNKPRGGR